MQCILFKSYTPDTTLSQEKQKQSGEALLFLLSQFRGVKGFSQNSIGLR